MENKENPLVEKVRTLLKENKDPTVQMVQMAKLAPGIVCVHVKDDSWNEKTFHNFDTYFDATRWTPKNQTCKELDAVFPPNLAAMNIGCYTGGGFLPSVDSFETAAERMKHQLCPKTLEYHPQPIICE